METQASPPAPAADWRLQVIDEPLRSAAVDQVHLETSGQSGLLGWQILPSHLGARPGRWLVAAVAVVQIHGTAVVAVQVVAPI